MPRRVCRAVVALALTLAVAGAGCGVPHGDTDRAEVEARTCASFLRRSGRPFDPAAVDPAVFARVRAEFLATGRPFSTLEPFLKACRSLG